MSAVVAIPGELGYGCDGFGTEWLSSALCRGVGTRGTGNT